MDTKSTLEAELASIQVKAAALAEKAKAGTMTDAELVELQSHADRATEVKAKLNGVRRAEQTGQIAAGVAASDDERPAAGAKGYLTPASFKSTVAAAAPGAAKAFVAGGASVTQVSLDQSPVPLGRAGSNLGILGVVPLVTRDNPTYSYLRQTVRTINAAEVATGAQKPTSVVTVERVDASLKVVAHLSEYIDSYMVEDVPSLETFLEVELRVGVFERVTAGAVAAYSNVSGAQTQAFTNASALDSIILGASKVNAAGYNADTVLLSRDTAETILLAKSSTGEYLGNQPGGHATDSGNMGVYDSLRQVIVTGLPAKTAIVFDSSRVQVSTDRQGVKTKWDSISKMDYNQVRALVEGRFAHDVLAAPAICKVGVAA